ncbi:urea transporter 2-like [Chelonus insularis]|uniref:urea transporter 2-like n=1 Tax=Chelonus insularis TaxID=460826 RepID=UPI00158C6185|nr:urea transporter 2-like [Chelonus insularis]
MEQPRVVCMGDFALLRDTISRKKTTFFWVLVGMIDSILRGTSQVILANNTISGVLILIALASTSPGIFISGFLAGFTGLIVSMLIQDPLTDIENGLTVYNPMLIGCITYSLSFNIYGSLDSFLILLTLIAVILSVYLTRALSNERFPCVTIPFNIVELILIFVLVIQKNLTEENLLNENIDDVNITTVNILKINDNETLEKNDTPHLDWGMVFRGIVTSSSQVFAVNDVAAGSIIYLAILIYSPITAVFSLLGAVIGCFASLGLDVPYDSIYSGAWGYNSLLSSSAFGGLFIIFNQQSVPLAFATSIFAVLLQYILQPIFLKAQLPILTVPFVITFTLFLGLRESSDVFNKPQVITFPEEHRLNYLTSQRSQDSTAE